MDVIGNSLAFDLAFVVDGSNVIDEQGVGNFRKCLEFVKEILRSFPVSIGGVHAGLITYGENARMNFNFDTVLDQSSLESTIDSVSYPGTESHTGNALETAMVRLFPHSGRQNVPHMLVAIIGSNSQDEVESAAEELRAGGVKIFCIGVGGRYDQSQLETIANSPSNTYVITTEFDTLRNLAPLLVSRISAGKYNIALDGNCDLNVICWGKKETERVTTIFSYADTWNRTVCRKVNNFEFHCCVVYIIYSHVRMMYFSVTDAGIHEKNSSAPIRNRT